MLKTPQGPLGIHPVKQPTQSPEITEIPPRNVGLSPTVHLMACLLGSLVRILYQTQRRFIQSESGCK